MRLFLVLLNVGLTVVCAAILINQIPRSYPDPNLVLGSVGVGFIAAINALYIARMPSQFFGKLGHSLEAFLHAWRSPGD